MKPICISLVFAWIKSNKTVHEKKSIKKIDWEGKDVWLRNGQSLFTARLNFARNLKNASHLDSGIYATARLTAVREPNTSRHHYEPIKDPLHITAIWYRGVWGEPSIGPPHYAERRESLWKLVIESRFRSRNSRSGALRWPTFWHAEKNYGLKITRLN